jgi:glycosyltransferase involved in cell wall biosynthesis
VNPAELRARPDVRRRFELPERFVVYTGNLDRYQDVPLLLTAMEELDVPLVVVTGSPDPLPNWVTVVRTPHFQDVLDVLSVAALAVIPRRQCTGFPIKLLNQLGMGCPTVMVDTAAQPLPGVIATSAETLATTLREQLASPEQLDELGRLGRAAVTERWSWTNRAERLEALYATLIPR